MRPNCPYCHQPQPSEYKFGFNLGLAIFLGRLFDRRGPARTDDLGLSYSQRTNSQKLRYWGLAEPLITADTIRKRGWWQITRKGQEFVIGSIAIPRYAITRRNEVLRLEGPMIAFAEVSDGYQYHQDYAEQVRNWIDTHQLSLFEGGTAGHEG